MSMFLKVNMTSKWNVSKVLWLEETEGDEHSGIVYIPASQRLLRLWQLTRHWLSCQNRRRGEALRYSCVLNHWKCEFYMCLFKHKIYFYTSHLLCRMSSDHAGLVLWHGQREILDRHENVMCRAQTSNAPRRRQKQQYIGGVYCVECTLIRCWAVFLLF